MVAGLRDPFSQLEYTGWQRVAGKYDSAWGGLTRLFIRPLLDAIRLEPSLPLLDVACGPGYVAEAARALGAAPWVWTFRPQWSIWRAPASGGWPSSAAMPRLSRLSQGLSTPSS